jgi:hypothetical protein
MPLSITMRVQVGAADSQCWFWATRLLPASRVPCVGESVVVNVPHPERQVFIEAVTWSLEGAAILDAGLEIDGDGNKYERSVGEAQAMLEATGWAIQFPAEG